jgi:hypothetical protein
MRPTFPLPFNRNPNPIITEPEHNIYGRYKVLRRVDGLFLVHDTKPSFPFVLGPVFRHETNARARAAHLASLDAESEKNEESGDT